jgi:hypothetical protein
MDQAEEELGPPPLIWQLLEGRALFELGAMAWLYPLLRQAPAGDGHPCARAAGLPRRTARSTYPLRQFLKSLGYAAHRWRLGRNLGGVGEKGQQVLARLQRTPAAIRPQGQRDRLEPRRAVRARTRLAGTGRCPAGHYARHAVPPPHRHRPSPCCTRTSAASVKPTWIPGCWRRLSRPPPVPATSDLYPHRRRSALAMLARASHLSRRRISAFTAATAAWATTRSPCGRSRIAWRNPRMAGASSAAHSDVCLPDATR